MPGICPHCGKVSDEESPRFCSGCGARMDGTVLPGYLQYGIPPPGYDAPPQKSPAIAGFCSSFLPGLGQVLNGETAKGFALFILVLAGLFLFLIPGLIAWLYAMYDAYRVAAKMNSGEIPFRVTRTIHVVLFVVFAVTVIVVALLVVIAMVMSALTSQMGTTDTAALNRMLGTNGIF